MGIGSVFLVEISPKRQKIQVVSSYLNIYRQLPESVVENFPRLPKDRLHNHAGPFTFIVWLIQQFQTNWNRQSYKSFKSTGTDSK